MYAFPVKNLHRIWWHHNICQSDRWHVLTAGAEQGDSFVLRNALGSLASLLQHWNRTWSLHKLLLQSTCVCWRSVWGFILLMSQLWQICQALKSFWVIAEHVLPRSSYPIEYALGDLQRFIWKWTLNTAKGVSTLSTAKWSSFHCQQRIWAESCQPKS